MDKLQIWLQAFRPRTLPLALSGIITGFSLSVMKQEYDAMLLILTLCTAVSLQVLSNLANDLGDFKKGTDDHQRSDRSLASGKVSEQQMKRAVRIFTLLSLVAGLLTLLHAFPDVSFSFWLMLIIGLLAIAAALNYTMGKKPYGYCGLGDLFVLLFFGFAAVSGTEYLISGNVHALHLFPAASIGLMAVSVLNLNNLRDLERDARSGKRTIAVLLGRNRAVRYQWFLHFLSALCWMLFAMLTHRLIYLVILLIYIPILLSWKRHPIGGMDVSGPERWNALLKYQALGTFMCSLLFLILTLF